MIDIVGLVVGVVVGCLLYMTGLWVGARGRGGERHLGDVATISVTVKLTSDDVAGVSVAVAVPEGMELPEDRVAQLAGLMREAQDTAVEKLRTIVPPRADRRGGATTDG